MTAAGMGGPLHMMLRTASAAGSMMMRRKGNAACNGGFPRQGRRRGHGGDERQGCAANLRARHTPTISASMSSQPRSGPESDRRRREGARSAARRVGHAQARGVLGAKSLTRGEQEAADGRGERDAQPLTRGEQDVAKSHGERWRSPITRGRACCDETSRGAWSGRPLDRGRPRPGRVRRRLFGGLDPEGRRSDGDPESARGCVVAAFRKAASKPAQRPSPSDRRACVIPLSWCLATRTATGPASWPGEDAPRPNGKRRRPRAGA